MVGVLPAFFNKCEAHIRKAGNIHDMHTLVENDPEKYAFIHPCSQSFILKSLHVGSSAYTPHLKWKMFVRKPAQPYSQGDEAWCYNLGQKP